VIATDFPALIRLLSAGGVDFIVIGGVAAAIHGSVHVTFDLDVLYARTADNLDRLARTLEPVHPARRRPCTGVRETTPS
jgi:hypothetical protein